MWLAILTGGLLWELCKEAVQEIPLCPDGLEGSLDDILVVPGPGKHLSGGVQGNLELRLKLLQPAMWHDFGKWDFEVSDEMLVKFHCGKYCVG
jgi:hypothetical protein